MWSLLSIVVATAAVIGLGHALSQVQTARRRRRLLSALPLLEASADGTFATTRKGYATYGKKGQAYVLRNIADGIEERVVLPLRYLDEVKDAPESDLSFLLFSDITMLASYSGSPKQSLATTNLVKRSLVRNLPSLIPHMYSCIAEAMREKMPQSTEWSSMPLYPVLAYISAKDGAFVLGAPEMSNNQEWIETSINAVRSSFAAGSSLRKSFPPWLWRLATFIDGPSINVRKMRQRARLLFDPVYRQYRANTPTDPHHPSTGIQWYIKDSSSGPLSLEQVTDDQLFLSLAAVHTTSASLQNTICDLVERPDVVKQLTEEVNSLKPEDGRWTAPVLARLIKLDSFMKESQRMHAIGLHTMARATTRDYIFKDGLTIPARTIIQMPSHEFNVDADNHSNPEEFDALRFVGRGDSAKKSANKYSFTSIAADYTINFGAGHHTCPGRGLAAATIKLVLVELLQHYELAFDEKGPPAVISAGLNRVRSPDTTLRVRLKQSA